MIYFPGIEMSNDIVTKLSTLLGYAIIIGSLTVKVPVILNVRKYRSSLGMSLVSIYLEALALSCHSAYNLQRGTVAQDVCLVALLWHYSRTDFSSVSMVLVAYIAVLILMAGLTEKYLALLPLFATGLGLVGTLPQIWANWKNCHTGALSPITQSLNVAGVFARVFTTLQLVHGDIAALVSVLVSAVLQVTLMVQILSMRKATLSMLAKQGKIESSKEE